MPDRNISSYSMVLHQSHLLVGRFFLCVPCFYFITFCSLYHFGVFFFRTVWPDVFTMQTNKHWADGVREIDESICLLVESSENTKNPVENPAYNSRNYATHTHSSTHTHKYKLNGCIQFYVSFLGKYLAFYYLIWCVWKHLCWNLLFGSQVFFSIFIILTNRLSSCGISIDI